MTLGLPSPRPEITNSIVSGNVAAYSGLSGKDGYGGGIYVAYGMLDGNTITDNRNSTADGGGGGGIYALYSTINNNIIMGNLAGRAGDPSNCLERGRGWDLR